MTGEYADRPPESGGQRDRDEISRGVVPEPHSLGMHSEIFRLGNYPSRHRKERDDAALLTQEGNSSAFTVTEVNNPPCA